MSQIKHTAITTNYIRQDCSPLFWIVLVSGAFDLYIDQLV